MKREEKNLLSRQRIIMNAITEFGTKPYSEASLNAICKHGNISKGIIYHYFKNKDELYLFCVSECFASLTAYLTENTNSFHNVEKDVKNYLELRQRFFRENPMYASIFASAVVQPPKHLRAQIKKIKINLDTLNSNYYEQALQHIDLKSEFCRKEAIEYFLIVQEAFHCYFQNKTYDNFSKMVDDHELKLSKLLKIMLYGIAKEKSEQ